MEDKKYTRQERTKLNIELKPQSKKCCSKCEEVKPISEFGKLKGILNAYPSCKVCNRKRGVDYRKNNPIKSKNSQSIYREKNREYLRLRTLNWTRNNAEKNRERSRKFREENLQYYADYKRNRRKVDADYNFMTVIMNHLKGVKNRQDFIDKWSPMYKMYDERGIKYHIDHMVPRSWFKTDTDPSLINHFDNLQVIDADYNLSKLDRWSDPVPSDYLERIRPFIKQERLGDLKSV